MSTAPLPAAPICSRKTAGVLVVDKDAIDRLNRIDEAITVATLPAYKPVVAGEMIATVKIIPFAVAAAARDQALAAAPQPLVRVAPYRIRKVGVVSTLLPGLSPKVIDKTLKITAERLAPAGATIIAERRVPHERAALARRASSEVLKQGAELVDRVRRLGDRRPARRHPGGAGGDRRPHRAFRHAGRSRQSAADRQRGRASGARRARLRAHPEGERLRLGADAAARRAAGAARGHHRHGRRRPADGNRHAAAAARGAGRRRGAQHRRRWCSPPAARAAWAGRTSCWPRSAAGRWCASSSSRRWPRARGR